MKKFFKKYFLFIFCIVISLGLLITGKFIDEKFLQMGQGLLIFSFFYGIYLCFKRLLNFCSEKGVRFVYWLVMIFFFIAGIFFIPLLIIGSFMAFPLLFASLGLTLEYACFTYTTPFRYIREFLTNTINGKNMRYDVLEERYYTNYPNLFEKIVFGVFGKLVYYAAMISIFFIIVSFRPYQDGCVYKQAEFESGDTVVVKINDEKMLAEVTSYQMDDENSVTVTVSANGKSYTVLLSFLDEGDTENDNRIKGVYITEDENLLVQLFNSAKNWTLYMIQRLPRLVRIITNLI